MSIFKFNTTKASALCFGFFAFSYFTSCKETTSIDPELVPGVDNINTFQLEAEDFNAVLNVHQFDSQVTNNPTLPLGVLGQLEGDPYFGNMEAGFYFQVSVPATNYSFPEDIVSFDSVRIALPFSGSVYGDTNAVTRFEVYEINDPSFKMDASARSYYAFSALDYFPTPIGSQTQQIYQSLKDTFEYTENLRVSNQVFVKLSDAFLSKITSIDEGIAYNHYSFIEFFNGFYVKPVATDPALKKGLFYFNLSPSTSSNYDQARMEVFYTTSDGNHGITLFPFHSKYSMFFSSVVRHAAGYPAEHLSSGDVVDSFIIQGGPGFQTDLTLSELTQIAPLSKIYLARLQVNLRKTSIYDQLKNPPLLLVNGVNEDGTLFAIADYQTSAGIPSNADRLNLAQTFVGGTPKETIIDGEEYLTYYINIPREIQRHVSTERNTLKLRIFPYYNNAGAYRFLADGFGTSSNARAKFSIIYGKP